MIGLVALLTMASEDIAKANAPCRHLTAAQHRLAALAAKRRVYMPDLTDVHWFGCAVVPADIGRSGRVLRADVLAHGGDDPAFMRLIVLHQRYQPSARPWRGLVVFANSVGIDR
jgi:hypothetical protein